MKKKWENLAKQDSYKREIMENKAQVISFSFNV